MQWGFTIPPAWPCHAVPPLHKGGCGAGAPLDCPGTGPLASPIIQPGKKALLCKVLFWGTWHRREPRREAGKRSGKNLVFPRGPAAASASDMIVISALRRNNTPPMAQEGPSVTLGSPVSGQPYFLCLCALFLPRQREERVQRHAGPVSGRPSGAAAPDHTTRQKGTLMQRGVSGALGTGGGPAGRLEKGRGKT